MNYARIRTWVNRPAGYHGKAAPATRDEPTCRFSFGMLWPDSKNDQSFEDPAALLKGGVPPGVWHSFTPERQARMLAAVISVVRAVPNERALGMLWWDAPWTNVPGNGWDPFDPTSPNKLGNRTLFDYENRSLTAVKSFNQR